MIILSSLRDVPAAGGGLALVTGSGGRAKPARRWLWLLTPRPWGLCPSRVNFSHLAKRLLHVFQEECVQTYQVSLVTHGKRMR